MRIEVELLAKEVFALLCLSARLDVVPDAAPHLQLREPLPLERDGELEPLDDVHRLEQLDALFEGQVRRVGRGVCKRARLDDRPQELADARVGLSQLQDLLDDRAVLGLELARLDRGGRLVRPLVDLGEQASAGAVWAAPINARWRPVSVTT